VRIDAGEKSARLDVPGRRSLGHPAGNLLRDAVDWSFFSSDAAAPRDLDRLARARLTTSRDEVPFRGSQIWAGKRSPSRCWSDSRPAAGALLIKTPRHNPGLVTG